MATLTPVTLATVVADATLPEVPTWLYSDPYGGALESGDAPPLPPLVDGSGAPLSPAVLPSMGSQLVPILPQSVDLSLTPGPYFTITLRPGVGFSWDYGSYDLPTGLPLDLGTIATPYAKSYDFTGFATYTEPAPLP